MFNVFLSKEHFCFSGVMGVAGHEKWMENDQTLDFHPV